MYLYKYKMNQANSTLNKKCSEYQGQRQSILLI